MQVYDAYVHLLLAKHAEAKPAEHAQSYVSAVMPQHTSVLGATAKLPAALLRHSWLCGSMRCTPLAHMQS